MKSIEDALFLLEDAENNLRYIEGYYENYSNENPIDKRIQLKVKQFLDNVRAALDYSAWAMFDTFCRENIAPRDVASKEKKYISLVHLADLNLRRQLKTCFLDSRGSAQDNSNI